MIGGKEKKSLMISDASESNSNAGTKCYDVKITGDQVENAKDAINKTIEVEKLKKNNNKVIQIGKFRNIYQVDYYAYFELKYYSS